MKLEKAIFACGCFWGAQYQFEHAKGVVRSTVGYIGGHKEHPAYEEVKAHTTGHAEATLVEFDAEKHRLQNCVNSFLRFTIRHRPTDKVLISVRSIAARYFI